MKKLLAILLAIALIAGLLPMTVLAATPVLPASDVALIVDGEEFTWEDLSQGIWGYGWEWDSAERKLILDDYDGSYIYGNMSLYIVLKDGSDNKISISDGNTSGISAHGDIVITGNGDLTIKTGSYGEGCGIESTNGDLAIFNNGDLYIEASYHGLFAPNGYVEFYGYGQVSIESLNGDGIAASGDVLITGNKDISISAIGWGIVTDQGDVVYSGTGRVYVYGTYAEAVYLRTSGKSVKMNGGGGPVEFKTPDSQGHRAIRNEADDDSPIDGETFGYYAMTGSPYTASVTYEVTPDLIIDGHIYGIPATEKDIVGKTWSWNAADMELTLNGYDGGYIKSSIYSNHELNLVLADGTDNKIEVPMYEDEPCGLSVNSNLTIDGDGNLTVNVAGTGYRRGIEVTHGAMYIAGNGSISVTSPNYALHSPDGVVEISGGGDLYLYSYDNTGIRAKGSVTITGDKDVTVDAMEHGIVSETGNLKLSGEGIISVYGANGNAVRLEKSEGSLVLDGTGAPLEFTSGRTENAAVYNSADVNSPVEGISCSYYDVVTGAPDEAQVKYDVDAVLVIDGKKYKRDQMKDDLSGDGWNWVASTGELVLNGYDGGYIKADGTITIILADGTDNRISVPGRVNESGLTTKGSCIINGGGNLTVETEGYYNGGIKVNLGHLFLNTEGKISIASDDSAISVYDGYATLCGNGDVSLISEESNGIYANGDITVSGNCDLQIRAKGWGLYSKTGDVVFSGCGKASVLSLYTNAVKMGASGKALLLDGRGAPLEFETNQYGAKAVYNEADDSSPVGGENIGCYVAVDGAPDTQYVLYDTEPMLTVDGHNYPEEWLKESIVKDGWEWDAERQALILHGYDGGYIRAERELTVILEDGTDNRITVAEEGSRESGLCAWGNCTVTGDGNLYVEAHSTAYCKGIYAEGELDISNNGDIIITSGDYAIDGEKVLISGIGTVQANSINNSGIYSGKSVTVDGHKDVKASGMGYGIVANGDVEFLGTGSADVYGAYGEAVRLDGHGSAVLLNGTGAPLLFRSWDKIAVYNETDDTSPVRGASLNNYTRVEGDPGRRSVRYDIADEDAALIVDGYRYTGKALEQNIFKPTWEWNTDLKELKLINYDGGYIFAQGSLDIVLADETDNRITVREEDTDRAGLYAGGYFSVVGRGDLSIDADCSGKHEGIEAEGSVNIYTEGDVTVEASSFGITSNSGYVLLGGSGDARITSNNNSGIAARYRVEISGSRNVRTSAMGYGIVTNDGDVILSGTGKTEAYGSYAPAVMLQGSGRSVLLEGSGAPLLFKSFSTSAIYNEADQTSPVGGANLSYYTKVTGAPGETSVTYDGYDASAAMIVDGKRYSSKALDADITEETWNWNAGRRELTLDNYNGGYIWAQFSLKVVLAAGSGNTITVPEGTAGISGLTAAGFCEILGSGDLYIHNYGTDGAGIEVQKGRLTINTENGNIAIDVNGCGISVPYDMVTISGGGYVHIDSVDGNGFFSRGDVLITGSKYVDISAAEYGMVVDEGDITLRDTAGLAVFSTNTHAVMLCESEKSVRLEGMGGPMQFMTEADNAKAVYNDADKNSPVGGSMFGRYDLVVGAPDERIVIYDPTPIPMDPVVIDETGADATVTFISSNCTAAVCCEVACVVLAKTGEDEYTRLTAVEGPDGSYVFDLSGLSGNYELVVAKKGDANLDGILNSVDLVQARAAAKGKLSMNKLNSMAIDTNADGTFNSVDIVQMRAMFKGKLALSW